MGTGPAVWTDQRGAGKREGGGAVGGGGGGDEREGDSVCVSVYEGCVGVCVCVCV